MGLNERSTSPIAGETTVDVTKFGLGRASEDLVKMATSGGFTVVATGPNKFRLARTTRPLWATVCTCVFAIVAGLGLLFLLVKRTTVCEAQITESRQGVLLRITGEVPEDLHKLVDDHFRQSAVASGRSAAPGPTPTQFSTSVAPVAPPTPAGQQVPMSNVPASLSQVSNVPVSNVPVSNVPVSNVPWGAGSVGVGSGSVIGPQPGRDASVDKTVVRPTLNSMRNASTSAPGVGVFAIRLPNGQTIDARPGGVIGRNPVVVPENRSGVCVPLSDPSLSKTHAIFGASPNGVWVIDNHSTNGTSTVVGGVVNNCQPGTRYDVPVGGQVILGEVAISVVGGPL